MTIGLVTNVLLDVFYADSRHGASSANAIRKFLKRSELVVCEVVWAELGSLFASRVEFEATLAELGVTFSPMNTTSASRANTGGNTVLGPLVELE